MSTSNVQLMSNYRCLWIPGGIFAFTVALLERRRTLLVDHVDLLRESFQTARERKPFTLLAWVILPDHLHCILRLPESVDDNASRWRHIKGHFARALPGGERIYQRRLVKGERGIGARRYWERLIRQEHFRACIDYIPLNPMKHGHARRVADRSHSSFHNFVEAGLLPTDWAGDGRKAG